MRIVNRPTALILTVGLLAGSCAAPMVTRVSHPEEAASDAFGGWITLWRINSEDPSKPDFAGELIAASLDHLILLTESSDLIYVAWNEIAEGSLIPYHPNQDKIARWAFLGALSTVPIISLGTGSTSGLGSHGYVAIYTAPIWLIAGISTYLARYNQVQIDVPRTDLTRIQAFARFPQGLPEGLEETSLTIREPHPHIAEFDGWGGAMYLAFGVTFLVWGKVLLDG